MSYEVFPVPFVGPVSTVVNWLVDGRLPDATPWEVLSQSGPQRRFLQDMAAPEIFFQSCYVLFRGAIQVSIYGGFAYSVVVACFAINRWWFDTDWFWPNYGMPHNGFHGNSERVLRDCGDYIEHMWMAGAETRFERNPLPEQGRGEQGLDGSHEDQHAAYQAMETMLDAMNRAFKGCQLPREKKKQYNAKVRDWRRLAKLGMRLGRTEAPRFPFITAEEALNIPSQTPEEAEFWRMVDDHEAEQGNPIAKAEEDSKYDEVRKALPDRGASYTPVRKQNEAERFAKEWLDEDARIQAAEKGEETDSDDEYYDVRTRSGKHVPPTRPRYVAGQRPRRKAPQYDTIEVEYPGEVQEEEELRKKAGLDDDSKDDSEDGDGDESGDDASEKDSEDEEKEGDDDDGDEAAEDAEEEKEGSEDDSN